MGLDHAGELELRSTTAPPGRAVTHDVLDGVDLEPPLAEGETPLFTVRAFAEGRLEVTDAIRTLDRLFRGGEPLADPVGECGVDPTADGLECEAYSPCE